MRNRITNGVNQGLDSLKSVAKTGLKLAPAVLVALLSTQAKAETWVSGIDIDNAIDGSATGTNINDGSFIWSFSGSPDGVNFREIDDGAGGSIIETSTGGVSFTDITADIKALDSSLASSSVIEVSGYDESTDTLGIFDLDHETYWTVSNASDPSLMSAVELNGYGLSIGSIDPSNGDFMGAYDNASDLDPAVYSTSAAPSVVYTHSGDDIAPISDIYANDRLFVTSVSANIYVVTDATTASPTRTAIVSTGDAASTSFESASTSSIGYDRLVYITSAGEVQYVYDSDSAVATVDPDTDGDTITDSVDACVAEDASGFDADADGCIDDVDGDGSKADVDCDDTDSGAFPGNAVAYADGADNDCLDSAPEITAMSISPSTVEVGVSTTLSASSRDDETSSPTITWEVRNSAGTLVDSMSGSSSSFSTTTADTYTITATATDGDGNSVNSSDTLVVSETSVVYEDLPTTDGPVTDGTYYEDPSNPSAGSITVAGVSIVGGVITLTGFGSSISGNSYGEIEYSAPDAGISGTTSADWVGDGVLGFMAMDDDEYPYSDTSDTTKMFRVCQTAGTLTSEGTFTDSEGVLEHDEEFETAGTYELADIVDDPDVVDTGDADTDTDTDSDSDTDTDSDSDTDTDTDTDADADTDTDSGVDSGDTGSEDDTGTNPPEGCPGCATENGANGSFAVGALALAALAARRRRN